MLHAAVCRLCANTCGDLPSISHLLDTDSVAGSTLLILVLYALAATLCLAAA
jgi:hypothetical protein